MTRRHMKLSPKSLVQRLCLGGVVLGTVAIAPQTQAAEQIILSYQGTEVSVTRQELDSFTETGVLPTSIQDLLGTDDQVPVAIRTLLNEEIKVPAFVDKFLNSPTGEFVLGQLDDTIRSTSGGTEQDLFDLKTAFSSAANDNRLSFMELVRKYPQKNVRVDLSSLESTYNRVSNFVERVQPALEVAKGFLSDIICECDTTASTESSSPLKASTPALNASSDKNVTNCNTATVASNSPELLKDEATMQTSKADQ